MARPPDTALDAAVLAAVAKHPDGASIEQIVGARRGAESDGKKLDMTSPTGMIDRP